MVTLPLSPYLFCSASARPSSSARHTSPSWVAIVSLTRGEGLSLIRRRVFPQPALADGRRSSRQEEGEDDSDPRISSRPQRYAPNFRQQISEADHGLRFREPVRSNQVSFLSSSPGGAKGTRLFPNPSW